MTSYRILSVAVVSAWLGLGRAASADTVNTAIGQGIGTSVADVFGDGSNVAIQTSIASVTYGDPTLVERNGLTYYEVLGSVQGTGWGGAMDTLNGPGPTSDAESHYNYNVPFVLRWRTNFKGTLVFYAHGYPNLGLSLLTEFILGADDESRRIDELESLYVSDGALTADRGYAVFAANLGGLRRDGTFAATALEGPFVGQPLNLSADVPITRDLARVAKRLLLLLAGTPVQRTIGVGHSGGALVMQWTAGGVTTGLFEGAHKSKRIYTGGNFVTPYVPESGLIFDGVIPIAGGSALLHSTFPVTAKMLLIGGEADYAAVNLVSYAGRILAAGVDVNQMLRIYQISSLPHNFAELFELFPLTTGVMTDVLGFPPRADSDHLSPVVAAAVDNMEAWLSPGTPPPASRISGQAIDTDDDDQIDAIRFPQSGGLTTSLFPFGEAPAIDAVLADQSELSFAGGFVMTTLRYAAILNALTHETGSLRLPNVQCRIGGYEFTDGARLDPFDDLASHWSSFNDYRGCVIETMKTLDAAHLYDKKIGGDVVFTTRIRGLFGG